MDNVSRPLIALLVGTVAFFALWIVALKPSTSTTGGQSTTGGLSGYQSAIGAAHNAVKTSDKTSVAHGGTVVSMPTRSAPVTTPSPSASAPAVPAIAHKTKAAHAAAGRSSSLGARDRVHQVNEALAHRRVVALLFFNPAGADDRAVKRELASVPTHHGRVFKLAVPIGELTRYPVVSTQVPVTESPTLVLIDAQRQATTIQGFTDRFEIAGRVDDALAVR